MNHIKGIIIGFTSCAILWAFHAHNSAEAGIDYSEAVRIAYKQGVIDERNKHDDIGLVRLSLEDIEEKLK